MRIREEQSFYITFETLTGGRKISVGYGVEIPPSVCSKIIYYSEYNRILCSDVAEHMIRGVCMDDLKIIPPDKNDVEVFFSFTKGLSNMLEAENIGIGVAIQDIIRSCLIKWNDDREKEKGGTYMIR